MPGRYPTVDELTSGAAALAAAHPDRVVLRCIGTSRAGEPIRLMSVGRGSRHALVVAGPHANEPVGGLTVLRLARYLLRPGRPARFTDTAWHFVLCLDPDGARRNERWLKGPMTFAQHYRNFFRPGFAGQPEWLPTEPGAEPMPETRALLGLQDELRPYLQCSLHGVDVGGSFVQLTRALPGLSDELAQSAADLRIPVELGPYDAFFWPSPGPGVYDMPRPQETDQFVSLPAATATSTWFHPHPYGTVTAVVEAPMWGADGVGDTSPHPDPYGALETISRTLRQDARTLAGLLEQVRPHLLATAGPLLAPVDEYLAVSPGLADEWAPEAAGLPPMNRARIMALRIAARRLVVRTAGMLHQTLPPQALPEPLAEVRSTLDRFLTERCAAFEADCGARWIPVRDQAEHQFRIVLAAAELAERSREPRAVRA
ncbi:M14 family zinc carboxypeptidase [Streptomyces sp. MnatMP-M17]|uniref:M14 family zinc carboxypeptidase n=1 Tax=unclassified Streptomyces TaxID=2593676 RepID=UPI00081D5B01|nr:M14 family zinc carboxypeptidase [Streptomyces sp. MnatMP-M17]MYZ39947.1 dehydrogenase [Streptomyces sp. SID4917]SCG05933.1 Zinc carboxypeptidase [Streptomyces sp. MnatMP-M17]